MVDFVTKMIELAWLCLRCESFNALLTCLGRPNLNLKSEKQTTFDTTEIFIESHAKARAVEWHIYNFFSIIINIICHHSLETLTHLQQPIDPMDQEDYFGVKSLIDLKEMFDARVHLGHHQGAFDPLTSPYIHGLRSTQHVIDLEKSMECLEVFSALLDNTFLIDLVLA